MYVCMYQEMLAHAVLCHGVWCGGLLTERDPYSYYHTIWFFFLPGQV